MVKKIFLSWQSDTNGNKQFLERALEKFVNENEGYEVVSADRNPEGDDDIVGVILERIDVADYIVADVSIINSEDKSLEGKRLVPNPNVMYELGYAKGKGRVRCILVSNKLTTEKLKELPFDIRNRRNINVPFDKKNQSRFHTLLAGALLFKPKVSPDLVDEIFAEVRDGLKKFHNPEWLLDHKSFSSIKADLTYFLDFVPPKLKRYRDNLPHNKDLYDSVVAYIDAMKVFSRLSPELGPESYEEQRDALRSITKNLEETIYEVIRSRALKPIDALDMAQDYISQLEDWCEELQGEDRLPITAFYKFNDGLNIYIVAKVRGGVDDQELLKIVDEVQKLTYQDIDSQEISSIQVTLKSFIKDWKKAHLS